MPISKPIRWSLIVIGVVCLLLIAPLGLIIAGNVGGAVLNSVLNQRSTTSELIGDYQYQANWGRAQLHIEPNGSFREEIAENGKPARLISGHWQALDDDNYLAVTFKPFGMVWDQDHASQTQGFGTQFYKPRHGKTYGVIDDDLGERFQQQ
jgi:hypothetical protein